MSEFQVINAMFEMLRNPGGQTMDRWGESVDCEECGQACSQIEIETCVVCNMTICKSCIEIHNCEIPEAKDDQ